MDFTSALSDMIKRDNADILVTMLSPLLKPNIRKTFDLISIDDALMVKPPRYEEKELISNERPEDIEFADEIEEKRIKDNYVFLMKNLIVCLKKSDILIFIYVHLYKILNKCSSVYRTWTVLFYCFNMNFSSITFVPGKSIFRIQRIIFGHKSVPCYFRKNTCRCN